MIRIDDLTSEKCLKNSFKNIKNQILAKICFFLIFKCFFDEFSSSNSFFVKALFRFEFSIKYPRK